MRFSLTSSRVNMALLVLLVLLGLGSFAYNQYLINRILEKERATVKLWAKGVEYTANPRQEEVSLNLRNVVQDLRQNPTVSDSLADLVEEAESFWSSDNFVFEQIISQDRFKIPTVIVDQDGTILSANHVDQELDKKLVEEFGYINPPIPIKLGSENNARTQFVYYGESPTVQYLRYFPYIQLSLLALFLGVAFLSYRNINQSEQSNIWVGMTKEAAHQLGTPLSSMYGWIELLREQRGDDDFVQEITEELENDISRLRGVAERFNKIGSDPELEQQSVLPQLHKVMDYMERRLPQRGKEVDISLTVESAQARALINPELFEWALENILKNSMNAIKSTKRGAFVAIRVHRVEDELMIDIEDSGRGIEKKYHDEIFKPGYSTKKRGWGLGLSLTRRIIEEYHRGKIEVFESEVGKGTTIRIMLKINAERS